MKEVVKYNNDFNMLRLPSFNELDQNLLFGMLIKVRDNSECEFNAEELKSFISSKNPTAKELYNYAIFVRDKFFKANFREIKEIDTGEFQETNYHLFNECSIYYYENESKEKLLTRIKLGVNPIFAYLVNELTANFTRFELAEFIAINGKYTKTLYRLLKQFRNTGFFEIEWNEFLRVMDIPQSYKQADIDKRILNPAIKELSAEPNLFTNEKQTIFKNLTYKKIKDPKGRGRGGKVIGIEFYFTPEPKRDEFKEIIQNLAKTEKEMEKHSGREPKFHILTGEEVTELTPYISRHFQLKNHEYGGYDTCKIKDLKYIDKDNKKMIWGLMINQENHKEFEMFFDNIAHMKNALKLD